MPPTRPAVQTGGALGYWLGRLERSTDKLQTQIAAFGTNQAVMPPPWVYRGSDGELLVGDLFKPAV